MTSVFGVPFDKLDYLVTDEELVHDISDEEKSIFVGGRYNQYHDNVFLLFGLNATKETEQLQILTAVYSLLSVLPPLIIILCQIGFGLFQSGASKYESAGIPFFVNMISFVLSVITYMLFGYALSQTDGYSVLGYHYWFSTGYDVEDSPDWLLGFALALTTVNIAQCGGLERCPLWGHVIITPVVSGLLHGFVVHWAWHFDGWLLEFSPFANVKYRDFAGSGIVHVVGGASALVLTIMLGPRYSRIRGRKSKIFYNDLEGHSLPLEMMGGYLLTVCYTCMSCSRVLQTCLNCKPTEEIAVSLINTLVSAGTSCLFTVLIVIIFTKLFGRSKVHWPPSRYAINGLHIGMVAVAAGCNVYPHWSAFVIGIMSSIGYFLWSLFLYNANIDDPLGVTAVHLGGGIWGLVCVSLFEDDIGLVYGKGSMLSFLAMVWNLLGALTLTAFSAFVTGLALAIPRVLNLIPLAHEQEIQGLDMVFVQQEAYCNGNKVTPFNTDLIEDRERYGDASPGSTDMTHLTSPTVYSLTRAQQEVDDIPYMSEISKPANIVLPGTPSYHYSPSGDAERRVWFRNSDVMDPISPDSPLIDYHKQYKHCGDIEL